MFKPFKYLERRWAWNVMMTLCHGKFKIKAYRKDDDSYQCFHFGSLNQMMGMETAIQGL